MRTNDYILFMHKPIDFSGVCGRIHTICKDNAETKRMGNPEREGDGESPLADIRRPLPRRPG